MPKAQYKELLATGKFKLQWGITSHQSEWPSSKSLQIINVGEGVEETATLLHCWWECTSVQPLCKTAWRSLKKPKNRVTIQSSNPTPGHISEKTLIQKDTCTPLFTALFTVAKTWKQSKCPSTDEWIKKMWYIYIYTHTYTYTQWNTTQP